MVMNSPVGLAAAEMMLGGELRNHSAMVHITKKTPVFLEWLDILGIAPERIIDGKNILARQLLVPEMGRCNSPSVHQLNWLRSKVMGRTPPPSSRRGRSLIKHKEKVK